MTSILASGAATLSPTVQRAAPSAQEAIDPRAVHAATHVGRFVFLAGQFMALLWALRSFQVEERAFVNMVGIATGGFLVHYWLPFRYKEPFWILLSLAGAGLLLGIGPLAILLGLGLSLFGFLASGRSYRAKVLGTAALAVVLMVGRGLEVSPVPAVVWPVIGALFMFRMMIYLYDLRQAKQRPSLQEYLAYFYPLPNFYFMLYPVVDLQTQRRTYFQRDIHDVAQQGLLWMARGTVQLLLYRLVYFLKPSFAPDEVTSFGTLVTAMVGTYLLYLRVSGQFHIIVGLVHMFGYDLPETHRRYLLASSISDFWRRINIYWKDFMVKLIYFPVYFRYRKAGDLRAKIVATICVFVTTWALHSYQWFWLRGELLLSWTDTLFWAILGALVVANVLVEHRGRRTQPAHGVAAHVGHGLKVAATLAFMTVLWSFWQSPTIEQWTTTVAWWNAR